MKLGDLVAYTEGNYPKSSDQMGLIINGPKVRHVETSTHPSYMSNQWEVFWMYCNKIGWWDEHSMEVIYEAR